MKKHFLLLAGALLAGATAAQPTTTDNAPVEGKTISVTVAGQPLPVKSVALNAEPVNRQMSVKTCPMATLGSPFRFPQTPIRRKVKYGKNRWVILG